MPDRKRKNRDCGPGAESDLGLTPSWVDGDDSGVKVRKVQYPTEPQRVRLWASIRCMYAMIRPLLLATLMALMRIQVIVDGRIGRSLWFKVLDKHEVIFSHNRFTDLEEAVGGHATDRVAVAMSIMVGTGVIRAKEHKAHNMSEPDWETLVLDTVARLIACKDNERWEAAQAIRTEYQDPKCSWKAAAQGLLAKGRLDTLPLPVLKSTGYNVRNPPKFFEMPPPAPAPPAAPHDNPDANDNDNNNPDDNDNDDADQLNAMRDSMTPEDYALLKDELNLLLSPSPSS